MTRGKNRTEIVGSLDEILINRFSSLELVGLRALLPEVKDNHQLVIPREIIAAALLKEADNIEGLKKIELLLDDNLELNDHRRKILRRGGLNIFSPRGRKHGRKR